VATRHGRAIGLGSKPSSARPSPNQREKVECPLCAPQITSGVVHALDIDPEMAAITRQKAEAAGLGNVRTYVRDFVADGTSLPEASVQYVMLFNILHAECPDALLREAYRVLTPGGKLGIIHWNYDPTTPRGPTMDIRPRPEQCHQWAEQTGFRLLEP
jgi:ubiquinone/menaquinone biosynthesis C-methylase UbiE